MHPAVYLPMKTGNYWIYQHFQVDTTGMEVPVNYRDSCYVAGDTLIRGKTFYKIFNFSLIRQYSYFTDSLHYVIDQAGRIILSSEDFSSVLGKSYTIESNDTLVYTEYRMNDKDLEIAVPAGVFRTINVQGTHTISPNFHVPGTRNPKFSEQRFALNVGLVYEKYEYLSVDQMLGRKLIRYRLN